jgi:hypothetical protein
MDWVTLLIEIVGVVILVIWTYLPIREFQGIHGRLRNRKRSADENAK